MKEFLEIMEKDVLKDELSKFDGLMYCFIILATTLAVMALAGMLEAVCG